MVTSGTCIAAKRNPESGFRTAAFIQSNLVKTIFCIECTEHYGFVELGQQLIQSGHFILWADGCLVERHQNARQVLIFLGVHHVP